MFCWDESINPLATQLQDQMNPNSPFLKRVEALDCSVACFPALHLI
jgi:hypothetical protein